MMHDARALRPVLVVVILLAALSIVNVLARPSIPAESVGIPTGAIILIDTGTCPTGFQEVAALSGQLPYGTVAANANVGTTGGSNSITPAGTVAAPTFTGTASTVVVNHVHVQSVNSAATGGLSGYTADTSTNTSVSSGYSTANPTGGSASYTPAGTNSAPAFTGTAFDPHPAFTRVIFCKKS